LTDQSVGQSVATDFVEKASGSCLSHRDEAHPEECAQLFTELRNYQIPDEHVQQDSVMALALACDCAPQIYAPGRVMAVLEF